MGELSPEVRLRHGNVLLDLVPGVVPRYTGT